MSAQALQETDARRELEALGTYSRETPVRDKGEGKQAQARKSFNLQYLIPVKEEREGGRIGQEEP